MYIFPLAGEQDNFKHSLSFNPLPVATVALKGFGLGFGYEYHFSPQWTLKSSVLAGAVPIDDYGNNGHQSFFLPHLGLRYYPFKKVATGFWLGSRYGLFLYHGGMDNPDYHSQSLFLYHTLGLESGYCITLGKKERFFIDLSVLLTYMFGGYHWGEVNDTSSSETSATSFLLLLPGLSFGYRL